MERSESIRRKWFVQVNPRCGQQLSNHAFASLLNCNQQRSPTRVVSFVNHASNILPLLLEILQQSSHDLRLIVPSSYQKCCCSCLSNSSLRVQLWSFEKQLHNRIVSILSSDTKRSPTLSTDCVDIDVG